MFLLTYYPHYIEPVYRILEALPRDEILPLFDQRKVRACFFGAGPAPEVLGWISFLNTHVPTVKEALAYILDKHVYEWSKGQEITRYHLAPHYWPKGKVTLRPIVCDILELVPGRNPIVDRAVRTSNFFVMQNCLNDQDAPQEKLTECICSIFRHFRPNSIFVLADLNYPDIRALMHSIEDNIVGDGLGVVVRSIRADSIKSRIALPSVVQEELLIGEDGLIPRQTTKYYSLVIRRLADRELVPTDKDEIDLEEDGPIFDEDDSFLATNDVDCDQDYEPVTDYEVPLSEYDIPFYTGEPFHFDETLHDDDLPFADDDLPW